MIYLREKLFSLMFFKKKLSSPLSVLVAVCLKEEKE